MLSLDSVAYNILIVKMSALGDIIQSLSVADYLKKKFPNSKISWVVDTRFKDLIESVPSVDRVLSISIKDSKKNFLSFFLEMLKFKKSLKKQKFDMALDLQGNSKSAFVLSFIRAKQKFGFSKSCVSEWPNLLATNVKVEVELDRQISSQYLTFVKRAFSDKGEYAPCAVILDAQSPESLQNFCAIQKKAGRRLLMICPGSNWENKRLADGTLIELLKRVQAKFNLAFIFIYGSKKEKIYAENLFAQFDYAAFIGSLKISQWQALMLEMDLVFAVDSSALHLASLANIPTFSVFGPSSLSVYKPQGEIHKGVQGSCPYNQVFVKHCPLLRSCKTGACIKELKVHELEKSFSEFFTSLL